MIVCDEKTSVGMPQIDTRCVFEFDASFWTPTFSIEHFFLDVFNPQYTTCQLIIHHRDSDTFSSQNICFFIYKEYSMQQGLQYYNLTIHYRY